jgi:hypothetical protein
MELSSEDFELLNDDVLVELNKRVIDQVIAELEPDQLKELADLEPDSEELMSWLDTNVPQFDDIVGEETIILLDEIVRDSSK